jgi:S-methylmethionine-dependent homocysteine/selenocysteine methylase
MAKYRNALPQLSRNIFITDGGIETDLIFHEGLDLPSFAAFVLLSNDNGNESLRKYFHRYAALARDYGVGLIFETVTWRSSPEWGLSLGYSKSALEDINRKSVELLGEIRREYENEKTKIVISGCLGPRGDGYTPGNLMSAKEAQEYHAFQIGTFSQTEADMVTALTINYVEEAIGIAKAAKFFNMPSVISFTVETDGRLPTGQTLKDAINQVDEVTANSPAYFMINCAHPSHFTNILSGGGLWLERIHGIRTNASKKSHADLDFSVELDEGDPIELAQDHNALLNGLKNLNVLGGCCGTDLRHIEEICKVALHHRDKTGT